MRPEGKENIDPREKVRDFLAQHSDATRDYLKASKDPDVEEICNAIDYMLERGQLCVRPDGTLYFPGEGPVRKARKETELSAETVACVLVRMLGDTRFRDSEGKDHDLHKEDVATLPDNNAKALIARRLAAKVEVGSLIREKAGETKPEVSATAVRAPEAEDVPTLDPSPKDVASATLMTSSNDQKPLAEPSVRPVPLSISEGESINRFTKIRREQGEEAAIAAKREEMKPPLRDSLRSWKDNPNVSTDNSFDGKDPSETRGYSGMIKAENSPMWRYTIDRGNKIPLDQLFRWPRCFAKIGIISYVSMAICQDELATALKRSGADNEQVERALSDVEKLYQKYALGEDQIDSGVKKEIIGCGLKVGQDFLKDWPVCCRKKGNIQAGNEQDRGACRGKHNKWSQLPDGELWTEGEGEDAVVGFSMVRDGVIITRTLEDWREADNELADLIEDWYEDARGVYHLPGRPDTERKEGELIKDLSAAIEKFSDLPPGEAKTTGRDSPYTTAAASHIACTAFYDMVVVRPGQMPVAETKSGKTRLTTITSLSSYRGFAIGNPTEAVIFRALGCYHVTLCIDECTDTAEVLPMILTIYKLSFDGQNIARCDLNDQRKIITYPCKGFVTLSLKNLENVPDDSINRGVVYHLGYKTRDIEFLEPNHPQFAPIFKDFRTRVAALRLKAQAGIIDIRSALERAGEIARRKYAFGGVEYELDSRDFTKAQTLLLPIVLMGEDERNVKDVMEVMLRSKIEGEEAQVQSFGGKCWLAFYDVVSTLWNSASGLRLDKSGVPIPFEGRDITTKLIADMVRTNLKNAGELLEDKDLPTVKVTKTLETLLFEFRSGAHRASFLVTDAPSFSRGWLNCVRKYGNPPLEEDQNGLRVERRRDR